MDEPFGPEYLRPAQKECPRCDCCTGPLCAKGQNSLMGCAAHADEASRESVRACPCSAETTKRTAAWRAAQISVVKLATQKPLLPEVEGLLRDLVKNPVCEDPDGLFPQLMAYKLAVEVHGCAGITPLGLRYLAAREEPRFPTPVDVLSVDSSTRTAQVVVVGWDLETPVTVLLDQLISATLLSGDELPGKALAAHANCRAKSADDLVLTDITVAEKQPEVCLEPAGGEQA
ncbi:hypothetical protein OV450_1460 [Actinobacteria bacterium OV450]|nr:hypothetical protein OV450_1460 [Actinobacteria bacterium OV450]